jgi:hypothetical protein
VKKAKWSLRLNQNPKLRQQSNRYECCSAARAEVSAVGTSKKKPVIGTGFFI